MLPGRHRTDYCILGVLGALTAGVLVLLVVWGWMEKDRSGLAGVRTTHSTNVDGAIVCYTLFERLGVSVARSEKILLRDMLDQADVLFQLDPIVRVNSDEIEDIQAWLISGGILVCTEIPTDRARDFGASSQRTRRFGSSRRVPRKSDKPETAGTTGIPVERGSLPLARDVSQVYFETSEVLDVAVLDSNGRADIVEALLVDDRGARIAAHKLGRGRFIVLSDSSFLANGQIGKGDNSVLAVNLVSYALSKARGSRVVFDEYHLGYGYHETGLGVLSVLLFTTAAGGSVLSLTVAGVLYLIHKGRRFGFRRDLERKQRRSKLEYIYGVGATYRCAGANRLTLELIYVWLKRRMTSLVGLAHNASNGALAAGLSGRTGTDHRRYKDVLDRCDKLLARARFSERDLLLAMKQLAQIETEVFNEHRNRE